jgi:TetR/AcrR family transcriptional repressor of nem operon
MKTIKKQMIQNATVAVQNGGVNSITMRTLGESVGIKSASVMYHFKNKDGLINELISNYHVEFFKSLESIDANYAQPFEKLEKLVDIFIGVLNENKFCLCGVLAMQNSYLDDEAKQKTQQFFQKLQLWIEDVLKQSDIDSSMRYVILSALEGALLVDQIDNQALHLQKVKEWISGLKS